MAVRIKVFNYKIFQIEEEINRFLKELEKQGGEAFIEDVRLITPESGYIIYNID